MIVENITNKSRVFIDINGNQYDSFKAFKEKNRTIDKRAMAEQAARNQAGEGENTED